jgi:hypothetical protein
VAGWLGGCVAMWLYGAFAKRSRTPENPAWIGSRARFKGPPVWLMCGGEKAEVEDCTVEAIEGLCR